MQAVLVSAEWLKKAFSAPSGALRAPSSAVPRTLTNSCGAPSLLGCKSSPARPRAFGSRTSCTGSRARSSRAIPRRASGSRVGARRSPPAACVTRPVAWTTASSPKREQRSATPARSTLPNPAPPRVPVPLRVPLRVPAPGGRRGIPRDQRLHRRLRSILRSLPRLERSSASRADRLRTKFVRRIDSRAFATMPIETPEIRKRRATSLKCNAPTI